MFPLTNLSSGLYDSTFLKRPGEVIPKFDKLYTEYINSGYLKENTGNEQNGDIQESSSELINLLHSIHVMDSSAAWSEFQKVYTEDLVYLRGLTRIQWSFLLNLVSARPVEDENSWQKTNLVLESMMRLGNLPTPTEYARILKTAGKRRHQNIVDEIWSYIRSTNADVSVDLWNSYIRTTCNADETMWFRRFNRADSKKTKQEPVATNHAVTLVTQMIEDGTTPNARTFELVLLYLGQAGDLEYAKSLILSLWGISLEPVDDAIDNSVQLPRGDLNYPTISTLNAIMNAFGVSDNFVTGLRLMEKMQKQYKIPLDDSPDALQLWKSTMRWAFWTSEPWGSTPPVALELVWKSVIETYGIKPSGSIIHYKFLRELCRRDYDSAARLIPMLLESPNVKHPRAQFAQSLKKVARGYVRIGEVEKCYTMLNKWAPLDPMFQQVLVDVQSYDTPAVRGNFSPDILSLEHLEAAADEFYKIEEPSDPVEEEENSETELKLSHSI